ncbi:MAG: xanthine dehydrogenase family protein subunit M [Pseudomonadota bacterium]
MKSFDHVTPQSLPEAIGLLDRLNGGGRVIAGGTDLMLQMRSGTRSPRTVVNIKRLPELKGLVYDPAAGLRLGSLTSLRELTRSPIIAEHYPCLAETAGMMASEQIRSFATLGGNLCNGSPSADLAPPLMVLEATVCLVGPAGERHLPLVAFFLGPGKTALQPAELMKEIYVPPPKGRAIYLKQAPRLFMDIAVVGVAAALHVKDGHCRRARIALGAVAPLPLRADEAEAILENKPLDRERIAQAAAAAARACSPIDDVRGSAWYRRRMVEVLTRRAVELLATREEDR